MFGLGKNKSVTVEDESIKDKSKFVVVGFTVMILSFFIFVISEMYTSFAHSLKSFSLHVCCSDTLQLLQVTRQVQKYSYMNSIMII